MKTNKIIGSLLFLISCNCFAHAATTPYQAIVIGDALNVRANPYIPPHNNKLYLLNQGDKIIVYKEINNWCRISESKKDMCHVTIFYQSLKLTKIKKILNRKKANTHSKPIKINENNIVIKKESGNLINIIIKLIDEVNILKDDVKKLKKALKDEKIKHTVN